MSQQDNTDDNKKALTRVQMTALAALFHDNLYTRWACSPW